MSAETFASICEALSGIVSGAGTFMLGLVAMMAFMERQSNGNDGNADRSRRRARRDSTTGSHRRPKSPSSSAKRGSAETGGSRYLKNIGVSMEGRIRRYGMTLGVAMMLMSLVVIVCFVNRGGFSWLSLVTLLGSSAGGAIGAVIVVSALSSVNRRRVLVLIISCFAVVVLISVVPAGVLVHRAHVTSISANERMTSTAWDAYDDGRYDEAVQHAEACIMEFKRGAERRQNHLEQTDAEEPPPGRTSLQQKKTIFANGLLNDVATCFYIEGRALEAMGQVDEAKEAYLSAARYSYARCWNPDTEEFWSPAEGALDRLEVIDGNGGMR